MAMFLLYKKANNTSPACSSRCIPFFNLFGAGSESGLLNRDASLPTLARRICCSGGERRWRHVLEVCNSPQVANKRRKMNMRILRIGVLAAAIITASMTASFAAQSTFVVSSGGAPALSLKLPAGCEGTTTGDKSVISDLHRMPKFQFQLWVVEGKKTVDEAVAGVADTIKSEFQDFKVEKVGKIKVAGAPAKHIIASGTEADDGDPGNAEVVVFASGGRVFVACVHGEGDYAKSQRKAMMGVLNSAKAP